MPNLFRHLLTPRFNVVMQKKRLRNESAKTGNRLPRKHKCLLAMTDCGTSPQGQKITKGHAPLLKTNTKGHAPLLKTNNKGACPFAKLKNMLFEMGSLFP